MTNNDPHPCPSMIYIYISLRLNYTFRLTRGQESQRTEFSMQPVEENFKSDLQLAKPICCHTPVRKMNRSLPATKTKQIILMHGIRSGTRQKKRYRAQINSMVNLRD